MLSGGVVFSFVLFMFGENCNIFVHAKFTFIISPNEVFGDIMVSISPNEVFGDIMVLASPPPVDPNDMNTLTQQILKKKTYIFQILYEGRYPPKLLCY